MKNSVYLSLLLAGLASPSLYAQSSEEVQRPDVAVEGVEDPEEPAQGEPIAEEVEPVEEVEVIEEAEETAEESAFSSSPIADLASQEFQPLEDIEEGVLATIIPAKVYPRVEWGGGFRFRSLVGVNWDLDTNGTSAIAPPLESYVSGASPDTEQRAIVDREKEALWSSNMRLRLDPTLHITDSLGVHLEVDMLRNMQFGSLPTSSGFGAVTASNQAFPNETNWFQNAIEVNEAYGYVETIFGEIRAGRMDEHWGLGMWMNDGDCADCDYGNTVDRFMYRANLFGVYGTMSVDFPAEGLTTRRSKDMSGVFYDASQIDDSDQYTISLLKKALTREERELEQRRLLEEKAIVLGGGVLYRYRNQEGRFDASTEFSPETPPTLVYEGLNLHIFDLVGELKYQPSHNRSVHIQVEAALGFGSLNNSSGRPVGGDTEPLANDVINCFDEGVRAANLERCLSGKREFLQVGAALESEIHVGGPVRFGIDAGFASGGETENWGLNGDDSRYFRFNQDYHVDLILFRNVIGTVTNAAYYRPHLSARFLEAGERRLQLDAAAILSHAIETKGTPGDELWLGLEGNAGFSYILENTFKASLEAGLLFPFAGLAAREDARRIVPVGGTFFDQAADPGLAWTVQSKFFWNF